VGLPTKSAPAALTPFLALPSTLLAFKHITDTSLVPSEQQATSDLFAGAIGLFKNPTSHRADAVSNPEDAVALVILADYLLRFVEQRVAAKTSGP
jgi:hypothetical protein